MSIKNVIKKIIGKKIIYKYSYSKRIKTIKKMNSINAFHNSKIYTSYFDLFSNIKLNNVSKDYFYTIDTFKTYFYDGMIIENIMLDYREILDNSLIDLKNKIEKMNHKNDLYKRSNDLLKGINKLIDRELSLITDSNVKESIEGIRTRKSNSFKDALQRILFLNQLLWQTNHSLNGLGRLDLILDSYYKNDIKNNIITKEEAKRLLKEFLVLLHKDYYFKSSSLAGDTGQIIILGGIDVNNNYFSNDLTYIFIELMEELKEPDPKVLLRVSNNIPKDLMQNSLKCIETGIGCPLFANDDVIIPKLIDFGYDKKDAYNYGTAACWEPYIVGKSFDQSNMDSICFIKPLNTLLEKENLNEISNIDKLLEKYDKYLINYLESFKIKNDNKKYAKDALLSLFIDNCIESEKDISCGGAVYNNFGFTGVGLSNVVNSIMIIDKYVFSEKKYTFEDFNKIRKNNFVNDEALLKNIKNEKNRYGVDNRNIINISNDIIKKTSKYFKNKTNPLGGKYKFGLSAPSYIILSKNFPASFDGRKNGEPFGVHISSDKSNGYTELINFASELDYGDNRFNGNVVDFFITPNFINDNFDKFVDFLLLSIIKGFFEMQMNVVNSKQLIEARKNPDKYPNLIVRVWGFSAYFKDLPDEYKDYLIERALKNEGNS